MFTHHWIGKEKVINHHEDDIYYFADNCLFTKQFMSRHNIIFKKIPSDIRRF